MRQTPAHLPDPTPSLPDPDIAEGDLEQSRVNELPPKSQVMNQRLVNAVIRRVAYRTGRVEAGPKRLPIHISQGTGTRLDAGKTSPARQREVQLWRGGAALLAGIPGWKQSSLPYGFDEQGARET